MFLFIARFEQFLQQTPDQLLQKYSSNGISVRDLKGHCWLFEQMHFLDDVPETRYNGNSNSNLATACTSNEANDEEFGSYEEAELNALFARSTILLPSQEAMLALPTSSFEEKPPTNTIDLCTPARIYSG